MVNPAPTFVPELTKKVRDELQEIIFQKERTDNEIIVKCIPELPDNVEIDENNNLIISITIPLTLSLFFDKKYLWARLACSCSLGCYQLF